MYISHRVPLAFPLAVSANFQFNYNCASHVTLNEKRDNVIAKQYDSPWRSSITALNALRIAYLHTLSCTPRHISESAPAPSSPQQLLSLSVSPGITAISRKAHSRVYDGAVDASSVVFFRDRFGDSASLFSMQIVSGYANAPFPSAPLARFRTILSRGDSNYASRDENFSPSHKNTALMRRNDRDESRFVADVLVHNLRGPPRPATNQRLRCVDFAVRSDSRGEARGSNKVDTARRIGWRARARAHANFRHESIMRSSVFLSR